MAVENTPLAYFITIACYGARLHGDGRGSVDPTHNAFGTPFLTGDPERFATMTERMLQTPYEMDAARRECVSEAILEVCRFRQWQMLALHIRTNHLHIVVEAIAAPERVANDFKSYASRRLNRTGIDTADRKRWARHESTIYLWTSAEVEGAVDYTLNQQGEPMQIYPHGGSVSGGSVSG